MKRINLTVIHIIIALVAVMFGSLKGQQNPILLSEKPEIIADRFMPVPYRSNKCDQLTSNSPVMLF